MPRLINHHSIIFLFFTFFIAACSQLKQPEPSKKISTPQHISHIAVLLPLHGNYREAGIAIREGILAGYYEDPQHTITHIQFYDTSQSSITSAYNQAVNQGAQVVIGPLTKEEVHQLINTTQLTVPTLTLNSISQSRPSNFLYQFGFYPPREATQVAEKAFQDGHRAALVISQNNEWGNNVAQAFTKKWQELGGTVSESVIYSEHQDFDALVKNLLHYSEPQTVGHTKVKPSAALRRQDFDMIFLVAVPEKARQIVPLLEFYAVSHVAIYSISLIYGGHSNPGYYRDMDGVIFCDIPWITIPEFKPKVADLRLYALGFDAYDIASHINNLPNSPMHGFSGKTGILYIDPEGHILQQLSWVQFHDGIASTVGQQNTLEMVDRS